MIENLTFFTADTEFLSVSKHFITLDLFFMSAVKKQTLLLSVGEEGKNHLRCHCWMWTPLASFPLLWFSQVVFHVDVLGVFTWRTSSGTSVSIGPRLGRDIWVVTVWCSSAGSSTGFSSLCWPAIIA